MSTANFLVSPYLINDEEYNNITYDLYKIKKERLKLTAKIDHES